MILIIGASGFLGQGLARYLSAKGHQVCGMDKLMPSDAAVFKSFYPVNDLSHELPEVLKKLQPECLIHLAGNADVQRSLLEPQEDFQKSAQLFSMLLDSVRQYSMQTKVIFASSAAIYGQPKMLPVSEECIANPISPYGYHKWMCEILAQEYASIYQVKVASMRIFSAYGAGLRRQILWDLCCKCQNADAIVLSGDGQETRDFIHQEDISAAVHCILKNAAFNGEVYNVATGKEVSIASLAQTLIDEFGVARNQLVFNGESRSGDPKYWRANINRLEALGFIPAISFSDGIREYVKWFKQLQ